MNTSKLSPWKNQLFVPEEATSEDVLELWLLQGPPPPGKDGLSSQGLLPTSCLVLLASHVRSLGSGCWAVFQTRSSHVWTRGVQGAGPWVAPALPPDLSGASHPESTELGAGGTEGEERVLVVSVGPRGGSGAGRSPGIPALQPRGHQGEAGPPGSPARRSDFLHGLGL